MCDGKKSKSVIRVKDVIRSKKNLEELTEALIRTSDKIPQDPKVLKEVEEFHKKVSYLTPNDLLQQFTI